jgi:hypothetical protein
MRVPRIPTSHSGGLLLADNILVCVDPERVDEIWPHVKDMLAKAFDGRTSDSTLASTEEALRTGRALLWVVWAEGKKIEAAATTELWSMPRRKVCVITACGGSDLEGWKHYMADFEQYARDEFCDVLRIYGRKGWKAVFQDFREPWVTLDKVLI